MYRRELNTAAPRLKIMFLVQDGSGHIGLLFFGFFSLQWKEGALSIFIYVSG